ncbi:MAG: RNA-guided endonuclease TnpB family protein [Comamonadaceae bacterium]|nr:RNA-guided endonuclease TnpB family protein [Comamonadaceae bacterium]
MSFTNLTISREVQVRKDQHVVLLDLQKRFAEACNFVHSNLDPKLNNPLVMQYAIYQDVRDTYGLPANLAIQAIRRVSVARKSAKFHKAEVATFADGSVVYDSRTFSLKEAKWAVSLGTHQGRISCPLNIGEYEKQRLRGYSPTSAQLLCKDGTWYLNIQIKVEDDPQLLIKDVLGVDLGRTDIAVTSDGDTFSGKEVTKVRNHYAKVRASLQKKAAKGTRSTRRRAKAVLKRLSGKEARFGKWTNHNVSKRLVVNATKTRRGIALEDLTGIRERTNKNPQSKTNKRLGNSWAFHQLRTFIAYKAKQAGVPIFLVNPAYTSQTCNKCLHLGNRDGKSFECPSCGWHGDADLNGARNIRQIGLLVNQPGGPGLACSWSPRATESLVL